MEARKTASSAASCKKHPKHRQSPGICSLCLRERLSKISTPSSSAVTNVSSSSSSSSMSSVSSVYSSHNSSNASSYTASPMQSYRNRRKIDTFEGKGYLYLLRKNTNGVLKKSRSVAFVSDQTNLTQDHEKKVGFWSKLMGSKRSSSRMMHSRTTRETFLSRA
ncbi:hypothetical protein L1887_21039 [Cichorium endivia]|nr:hypothetical protein L1887_21039 [Cichorium endivia]